MHEQLVDDSDKSMQHLAPILHSKACDKQNSQLLLTTTSCGEGGLFYELMCPWLVIDFSFVILSRC